MKLRFLMIVCMSVFSISVFAQVRATTESGNKVLLFDDGTWKYEERSIGDAAKPTAATAEISTGLIEVDSAKVQQTKFENFFYVRSPRLEKYFGDERSDIRCKVSCSNNTGTIKVHFSWEFPVADGNRYFGMFKEGTEVTMTLINGQKIKLIMGNENTLERMEGKNYSVIANASQALSREQFEKLISQPIKTVEVGWRKNSEEYDVDSSSLLKEELSEVL